MKIYKAIFKGRVGVGAEYGPTIEELIRYMLESGYKDMSLQEITLEQALQQDDFSMELFCDIFTTELEERMGKGIMTYELFDDNSMIFGCSKVTEDGEFTVDTDTGFLMSFSCPKEFFAVYSAMINKY